MQDYRCLTCKQRPRTHIRGLCNLCYEKTRRKIREGLTTWKELENAGLCRSLIEKKSNEGL